MSIWAAQQDAALLHHTFVRAAKGPSEKRRLARRLEERRQRRAGLPAAAPAPAPQKAPPVQKPKQQSHIQVKATRTARHAKRLRRKIRERQRLAARSGLPELVRRLPAAGKAATTGNSNKAAGCYYKGLPPPGGVLGTAAESPELSSDSRQKVPSLEFSSDG